MIRLILVDDQALVRAGLQRILRQKDGFEVVAECCDGAEVPAAVARHRPDVVVMDVRMKAVGGVEATRRLREDPDAPPVLVLTTFDDDEVLSAALRAGASGFVLKDATAEDIMRAVRAVAAGEGWLDPAVTGRVLATYRGPGTVGPGALGTGAGAGAGAVTGSAAVAVEELTARELEVVQLIGRGATNAEIAEALFVSEGTVKTHVGHVFAKLGLRDRAAAIVWAFDHGLVNPRS
ncbi:MAG TPA: response regulator transcription factor [Acidimicrobiales bacterium]